MWDEWGSTYGGAPEAVAVWHRRTEQELDRGRRCPASKALGIMAHMLGDVAQPMHTDQIDAEDSVHSSYESAVDSRCTASQCRYRARNDGWGGGGPYARTRSPGRVRWCLERIVLCPRRRGHRRAARRRSPLFRPGTSPPARVESMDVRGDVDGQLLQVAVKGSLQAAEVPAFGWMGQHDGLHALGPLFVVGVRHEG